MTDFNYDDMRNENAEHEGTLYQELIDAGVEEHVIETRIGEGGTLKQIKADFTDETPKLLILGHARHGKDTVAEFLRDQHGISFRSSSHFLAEAVVLPEMAKRGITYASTEEGYEDRVNHRALWREIIADYNKDDPAKLAKAILEVSDCYVGMRTDREYKASRPLFYAVAWVTSTDRGIPPEGRDSMTIDFDPRVMHLIDNNQDLAHLELQVHEFVEKLGLGQQLPLPIE